LAAAKLPDSAPDIDFGTDPATGSGSHDGDSTDGLTSGISGVDDQGEVTGDSSGPETTGAASVTTSSTSGGEDSTSGGEDSIEEESTESGSEGGDCGSGHQCVGGVCLDGSPGDACDFDSDCQSDECDAAVCA
jgi:hypothetical protein